MSLMQLATMLFFLIKELVDLAKDTLVTNQSVNKNDFNITTLTFDFFAINFPNE